MTSLIRGLIVLLVIILSSGAIATIWMAGNEDFTLRKETLIDADLAATGIDPGQLSLLKGSEEDLNSEAYQSLKKLMRAITAARPLTRFAYIMGQREDGTVFFFVDSEPVNSSGYSPPGQIYPEASESTLEMFRTGIPMTAGPITDRWGSWVNGFIPIKDPQSGKLLGVFGIDIDAGTWTQKIIISASLPAIASFLFSILIIYFIIVFRREEKERNNIIAAQNALTESEKRYSAIVNNAPEPVLIHCQGQVLFLNRSGEVVFGYSAKEMIGTNILSYLPIESSKMVKQAINSRNKGIFIEELEVEFIRKDGAILTLLTKETSIRYQHTDAILVHLNDITGRKEIELTLQETERKLTDIINFLPYPTLVTDREGIVTWWNRAMETISKVRGTDIIGSNIKNYVFEGEFRPNLISYIINSDQEREIPPDLQNDGDIWSVEVRLNELGKSDRYLLSRASPLYGKDGEIVGAIESIHDITPRKKRENTLRHVNQQLNLMASITRHDIRNGITIIRGYLDIVMEDPSSPDASEFLKLGKATLLRTLAQIEFTKTYQEIGLNEPVWQNLHDTFRSIQSPQGVSLTDTECTFEVYADLLFNNVFENLIDNSVRHGQRVSEVRIRCEEINNTLFIIYEDNGIGIEDEEKEQIFERGYGKNTGFGLFLIKEILAITNLSIIENGSYGSGARFEIKVPSDCYRLKNQYLKIQPV